MALKTETRLKGMETLLWSQNAERSQRCDALKTETRLKGMETRPPEPLNIIRHALKTETRLKGMETLFGLLSAFQILFYLSLKTETRLKGMETSSAATSTHPDPLLALKTETRLKGMETQLHMLTVATKIHL